jgi:peptidoglycan/xylan/chitin deacetylase (PgdA/CDA1 family)
MQPLIRRGIGKYRRTMADSFCRHPLAVDGVAPIVSFTFDDAPRSALTTGREILKRYEARATYYLSLALLDKYTEVGQMASTEDLAQAAADGNELGCHTFDHVDAWGTPADEFVASIARNQRALAQVVPGAVFRTFAYPKSGPTLSVKRMLRGRFLCCRGGGQRANVGLADRNLLNAFFLDRRTEANVAVIGELIEYNRANRGWLIFATHDVTPEPSPYGCTPEFLDDVARKAADCGALLLPVAQACECLLDNRSDPP